jgi:hypothetical protein
MTKIEKMIPFFKGRVVGIGIEEETILKAIDKNKKITTCDLIDSISLDNDKKGRTRKISERKIKKCLGKNNTDIILVNDEKIKEEEAHLIPFIMYLAKEKIYLYHIENKTKTLKRYSRYKVKIEEQEDVIILEVTNYKMSKVKQKMYFILDFFLDLIDNITELLIS